MAARTARQVAAVATVLGCLTLLTSPVAAAAQAAQVSGTSLTGPDPTPSPLPMALAHTGLDITGPLLAGFAALLLGVVLVAWAVLRVGRGSRQD